MLHIINRLCTIFGCIIIIVLSIVSTGAAAPEISASYAVTMLAQTGEILYAKNQNTVRSMASTTKIMTALLGIRYGKPDRAIKVTADMLAEGTSSGLKVGDRITILNLLYAMMLQSGNDAANAVAVAVGGSIEKFADLMNGEAQRIGMENTHFVTPSGLDADEHYTTAYDMALLTREALKLPLFEQICRTKNKTISLADGENKLYAYNHNRLLDELDGAIGVKTGFTKKSGRCLVTAVIRNGVTIITVTLNAPDDWNDHKKLTEYSFNLIKKRQLKAPAVPDLHIVGGNEQSTGVYPLYLPVIYENESGKITYKINMRPFEYAPINNGDTVGYMSVYRNGSYVESVPLVADRQINVITKNRFNSICDFFKKLIF